MIARLDALLGRVTMYLLVVGILGVLTVLALVLAATQVIAFDPLAIVVSALVLVAGLGAPLERDIAMPPTEPPTPAITPYDDIFASAALYSTCRATTQRIARMPVVTAQVR